MIITDKAVLKKYLPVNSLNDITVTDVHQERAWLKHFPKFIGRDLMSRATSTDPPEALIDAIVPPLANFTLLEAIPWLDLVLTGSGFGVVSNQNTAPASRERVDALAHAALEAANAGMDNLIYLIENDDELSDDWNKSCQIKGGLIKNTKEFQAIFDINESAVRFFAYKSKLELYQRKRLNTKVGARQIAELLKKRTDTQVLPLLRSALVYFAMSEDDIAHHDTGDEYLNIAIRYMIDNLDTYTYFRDDMYIAPFENSEDSGFVILG